MPRNAHFVADNPANMQVIESEAVDGIILGHPVAQQRASFTLRGLLVCRLELASSNPTWSPLYWVACSCRVLSQFYITVLECFTAVECCNNNEVPVQN